MTCRFLPHDRSIAVVLGEHVDPCAKTWMPDLEGRCSGCWPCPVEAERHCTVCAAHLDASTLGTCTDCRGRVRRDLIELLDLAAQLPDHALNAARAGHLAAASPIPGGDALVMLAPGSEGLDDDSDTAPVEILTPAFVLAWWEETWRDARDEPSRPPSWKVRPAATLVRAHGYLTRRFDWAASRHSGFHAFARDLRRTRAQLEEVLFAGADPARGVPCFLCGTTLERDYRDPKPCGCGPRPRLRAWAPGHAKHETLPNQTVCCLGCAARARWELALAAWETRHAGHDQGGGPIDADPYAGWACPRCKRAYRPGEYQLAISVLHTAHAPALPASELADRLAVDPTLVWQWAARGHIRRRGRAADGRTLYDVGDALRYASQTAALERSTEDVS